LIPVIPGQLRSVEDGLVSFHTRGSVYIC